MTPDRFNETIAGLLDFAGEDAELTISILDVVAVSSAAVSTMGLFGTETVAASDARAARLDELQFDLGEGPGWDAMSSGNPVLEPDLCAVHDGRWPALIGALHEQGVRAVFAFPLAIGPLRMGAIDLYDAAPRWLDADEREQVAQVASAISRHVLRRALRDVDDEDQLTARSPFSRRLVHQATGFVIAQLGVSAADAQLLIQGRAFAENRSVREVAESIIAGEGFESNANRIEDVK